MCASLFIFSQSAQANNMEPAILTTPDAQFTANGSVASLYLSNNAPSDTERFQRAGVTVTSLATNPNFTATLSSTPFVADSTGVFITGTVGTVQRDNRLNGNYTGFVIGQAQYTDSSLISTLGSVPDLKWNIFNAAVTNSKSGSVAEVKQAYLATGTNGATGIGAYGITSGLHYGLTSSVAGGFNATTNLSGTVSANTAVSMSYFTPGEFAAAGKIDTTRMSDIVHISGINETGTGFDGSTLSDKFVIELSYTHSVSANYYLAWYDPTLQKFVNAIAGNSTIETGQGELAFDANHNLVNLDLNNPILGTYGDLGNGMVWAVVDHTGDFTVMTDIPADVPEPSTLALGALGGLALLLKLRRRRS